MVEFSFSRSRYAEAFEKRAFWYKKLIIVVLVLLSTSIAIALPSFGDVIGVLGCVTISLLSYVLPSACHLKMTTFSDRKLSQSKKEVAGQVGMVVLGISVMIAGTTTQLLAAF